MEMTNSLGLRFQGKVAGWLITHRPMPETIQYTSLFIEPALQKQGLAIPFINDALRRQFEMNVPKIMFMVDTKNKPMLRFIDKYLENYLTNTVEVYYSVKPLGDQ